MSKIKEFLKRHIVITVFLIAIFIAVGNFLVYPVFIKKDMNLIDVPVARATIGETTKITAEMITTVSISADQLPDGIITDSKKIIGTYVAAGTKIPANGFFYTEQLTTKKNAYGNIFNSLGEGEYTYTMVVNKRYDQNGALKANQRVNIYGIFATTMTNASGTFKTSAFGQLAENLRILSITDNGTSEYVTFAVTEEELTLFTLAEQMGEIYPAVYFGSADGTVSSSFFDISAMRSWIMERAVTYKKEVAPNE